MESILNNLCDDLDKFKCKVNLIQLNLKLEKMQHELELFAYKNKADEIIKIIENYRKVVANADEVELDYMDGHEKYDDMIQWYVQEESIRLLDHILELIEDNGLREEFLFKADAFVEDDADIVNECLEETSIKDMVVENYDKHAEFILSLYELEEEIKNKINKSLAMDISRRELNLKHDITNVPGLGDSFEYTFTIPMNYIFSVTAVEELTGFDHIGFKDGKYLFSYFYNNI